MNTINIEHRIEHQKILRDYNKTSHVKFLFYEPNDFVMAQNIVIVHAFGVIMYTVYVLMIHRKIDSSSLYSRTMQNGHCATNKNTHEWYVLRGFDRYEGNRENNKRSHHSWTEVDVKFGQKNSFDAR